MASGPSRPDRRPAHRGTKADQEIAEELATRPNTVGLWRRRFPLLRFERIDRDTPRPGRPPRPPRTLVARNFDRTFPTKPRGCTQWSTRVMAEEVGVDPVTVQRVWRRYRLKPHRSRRQDRRFEEWVVYVIKLYQNPLPRWRPSTAWTGGLRRRRSNGPKPSFRSARTCPSSAPTITEAKALSTSSRRSMFLTGRWQGGVRFAAHGEGVPRLHERPGPKGPSRSPD